MARSTQNSVYAEKSNAASGQFQLNGEVANAVDFVRRFYAEASPSKAGNYDSYVNDNGPVRSDSFINKTPQGLGKISLIAIDQLFAIIAGDNTDDAAEAEKVVASLNAYLGHSSASAAERKQAKARNQIAALAAAAGLSADSVNALLGSQGVQHVPPVDADSDADSDSTQTDETVDAPEVETVA